MIRFALTWKREGVVRIIDFDGSDGTAFNGCVAAAVSMAETHADPERTNITVFMGEWESPDPEMIAAAKARLVRAGARLEFMAGIKEAAG